MDTSTPGSGSESSHECSPGDKKYMKLQLHYSHLPAVFYLKIKNDIFSTNHIVIPRFCVTSPVHWRVWTMPGCRPESPCLCSAAPDPLVCSRSVGTGRRCHPLTPAARAGAETRRWPSRPPGGRCTAALGGGWSCSTPVAARGPGLLNMHSQLRARRKDLNPLTLLSLPPDARCWWSGDHFRPHTSCL